MREQRRRLPRVVSPLEMLDDRIVPSAIGFTPKSEAALAGHSSVHIRMPNSMHPHHPRWVAHHLRGLAAHASAQATPAMVPAGPMSLTSPSVPTGAVSGLSASTGAGTPVMRSASGARSAIVPGQSTAATSATTTTTTTTPTIEEIKNGPLAKAGQVLITVYDEYKAQGAGSTFTSSQANLIDIEGTSVGVDIKSIGGDFNAFVSKLTGMGLKVRTSNAASGDVEGLLPIAQLPNVTQDAQTLSVSPISQGKTSSFSMSLTGGML